MHTSGGRRKGRSAIVCGRAIHHQPVIRAAKVAVVAVAAVLRVAAPCGAKCSR